MTASPSSHPLPTTEELRPLLQRTIEDALRAGATSAEAHLSASRGLSVSVRKGEVESVQFQRDRELVVTAYIGQRTGTATTTDLTEGAVREAVAAACAIARAAGEDPCAGLADAALMAREFPDLDLLHPWMLSADEAAELARECEAAAFAADRRVTQSEGAAVDTRQSVQVYGNTHGFFGGREATEHAVSCAAIAVEGDAMQVGHWYSAAHCADDLESMAAVGTRAGRRAAARLGARPLSTRSAPVLMPAEVARGLFGHFIGAISGGALYRRASFLLDRLGTPVFADCVNARQMPFIPRGAASTAFDNEGVATAERQLIDHGVLGGYLLSSYSARKLGMQSTGNSGGVFNLVVQPTFAGGLDALTREMGEGLIVTDLMGQGANLMTGDYSRGAAGFWVENGTIAYPVQEITIAGTLPDMFRGIRAIGDDVDIRGGVRCGSVLLDRMTIAGT
jgi:PmbA protein